MVQLHINSAPEEPPASWTCIATKFEDDEEEGVDRSSSRRLKSCKGTIRRPCSFGELLVTLAKKPQKKRSSKRAQLFPVPAKGTWGGSFNQNRAATFLNALAEVPQLAPSTAEAASNKMVGNDCALYGRRRPFPPLQALHETN